MLVMLVFDAVFSADSEFNVEFFSTVQVSAQNPIGSWKLRQFESFARDKLYEIKNGPFIYKKMCTVRIDESKTSC